MVIPCAQMTIPGASLGRISRVPTATFSPSVRKFNPKFNLVKCNRLSKPARKGVVQCSAAASDDPYKVLGIPRNADSTQILRAYRNKVRSAEGNEEQLAKIESAHTSLLMQGLQSRLKGGGKGISSEVKFADRPVYFPWRPRLYRAENKFIMITAALQAALLAWGLLSPMTARTQPVVASAVVGACANILKLNGIFPIAKDREASDVEKAQGPKNILRGAVLSLIATIGGCFLFYTAPDLFASNVLSKTLPFWFYQSQTSFLTLGSTLCNWIMSSFYR